MFHWYNCRHRSCPQRLHWKCWVFLGWIVDTILHDKRKFALNRGGDCIGFHLDIIHTNYIMLQKQSPKPKKQTISSELLNDCPAEIYSSWPFFRAMSNSIFGSIITLLTNDELCASDGDELSSCMGNSNRIGQACALSLNFDKVVVLGDLSSIWNHYVAPGHNKTWPDETKSLIIMLTGHTLASHKSSNTTNHTQPNSRYHLCA